MYPNSITGSTANWRDELSNGLRENPQAIRLRFLCQQGIWLEKLDRCINTAILSENFVLRDELQKLRYSIEQAVV